MGTKHMSKGQKNTRLEATCIFVNPSVHNKLEEILVLTKVCIYTSIRKNIPKVSCGAPIHEDLRPIPRMQGHISAEVITRKTLGPSIWPI